MPEPECVIECGCDTGSILMAKKTARCGALITCGGLDPNDGADLFTIFSTLIETFECEEGTPEHCTRVNTFSYNSTGPYRTADCTASETLFCDGLPTETSEGCPEREGTTGCDRTVTVANGFDVRNSPSVAAAAATPDEETEYTEAAITAMVGAAATWDGTIVNQPSWKFKRFGRRIPIHILVTIAETIDDPFAVTEYDVTITLAANETGDEEWALEAIVGGSRLITGVEIARGRLPTGW